MLNEIKIIYKTQYINYKYKYYNNTYQEILNDLSLQLSCSKNAIILYKQPILLNIDISNYIEKVTCNEEMTSIMIMKLRPISGDHFHVIYSFWVYINNSYKLITPLSDIYPITEHNSSDYREPSPYYLLDGLNAGVHTHGDGFIHIHPATAPVLIREFSEGLSCTLKLFFSDVGISYNDNDYGACLNFNRPLYITEKTIYNTGFTSSSYNNFNSLKLDSNNEMSWYLFMWDNIYEYENGILPKIYTKYFDNIWLYKDGAIFIFGYMLQNEVIDNVPNIIKNKVYIVTSGQISEFKKSHT